MNGTDPAEARVCPRLVQHPHEPHRLGMAQTLLRGTVAAGAGWYLPSGPCVVRCEGHLVGATSRS